MIIYTETMMQKVVAEARADQRRKDCAAVCQYCRWGDENWLPAKKYDAFTWLHQYRHRNDTSKTCAASPIHELQHQETLTAQSAEKGEPL